MTGPLSVSDRSDHTKSGAEMDKGSDLVQNTEQLLLVTIGAVTSNLTIPTQDFGNKSVAGNANISQV